MSFRCSVVLRGVSEGSFHAGSSLAGNKPTDLAQHQKARLFSPDAFKTSKYQNLPMYHFQKWLGFSIFCYFDTCHKGITIDSLIGSPCIPNCQIHKYTNTAYDEVPEIPNKCYISKQLVVRGCQKWYSQVSQVIRSDIRANIWSKIRSDIQAEI